MHPGVTLVAISSRWSCMASLLQVGSTRAAPVPRSRQTAPNTYVDWYVDREWHAGVSPFWPSDR